MQNTLYTITDYVSVAPGAPFRLLPLGRLVKDGKVRELTRELLAKFRLPHFRPAIKLGSHADETRAGGHITGLEVRDDGLYAIPELTPEGEAALERGDYRYHSPEIIWDGYLEDPQTGDKIEGPIIMGDALLHTPHLGEAAALYHVEVLDGGNDMTAQNDMVSIGALERLRNFFATEPAAPIEPNEPQRVEAEPVETFEAEYQQAQAEIERLTAEVADMMARQERDARITNFAADLGDHVEVEVFETLADLTDEQAEVLMRALKALMAQADAAELTEDVGDAGAEVNNPEDALSAAIAKVREEQGVDYNTAMNIVRNEQPEVFRAWYGGGD